MIATSAAAVAAAFSGSSRPTSLGDKRMRDPRADDRGLSHKLHPRLTDRAPGREYLDAALLHAPPPDWIASLKARYTFQYTRRSTAREGRQGANRRAREEAQPLRQDHPVLRGDRPPARPGPLPERVPGLWRRGDRAAAVHQGGSGRRLQPRRDPGDSGFP